MFKKTNAVLAAAMLAVSAGAFADSFTFNPGGTSGGTSYTLGSFDQLPGNSLAVGGGGTLNPGSSFTLLYQANLGAGLDVSNHISYVNGSNGTYFTFVAGFGETVTSGGGATAGFSLDQSNPVNFFKVYANTNGYGNDLTGAGFTNGTVILSGHIINTGFASSFNQTLNTTTGTVQTGLFDQHTGDDYAGKQSIFGSGGTSLNAMIDSINAAYFPDLSINSSLAFFNTSQSVPFTTVDPSRAFIDLTGSTSGVTAPNLCTINGQATSTTCTNANNFQLLADGNNTFTRAVPEPDSLMLMGLGLSALGLGLKRRRKTVA